MPDTIITGSGDSSAGVIVGIVLALVLVLGGLWLFNNGYFNGAGSPGPAVTVNVPAAPTPAPAN